MSETKREIKEFKKIPDKYVEWIDEPKSELEGQVNLKDMVVYSDREGEGEDSYEVLMNWGDTFGGEIRETVGDVLEEDDRVPLIIEKNHHRAASMMLGQPVVVDTESKVEEEKYRSVFNFLNVKGLGYIYPEFFESKSEGYYGQSEDPTVMSKDSEQDPWGYQVLGMLDKRVLDLMREATREMEEHGARIETIAGSAQINACYYEGNLCTIDDLKHKIKDKHGDLVINDEDGEFEAIELFRLQRVDTRIIDLFNADKTEKKKLLAEAFLALNRENEVLGIDDRYNIDDSESIERYLKESGYEVGKNLGIMQGLGRFMTFFNSGNITLGKGELVDLDSVLKLDIQHVQNNVMAEIRDKRNGESFEYDIPSIMLKDVRDSIYAMRRLIISINKVGRYDNERGLRNDIYKSFMNGYKEGFSSVLNKSDDEEQDIDENAVFVELDDEELDDFDDENANFFLAEEVDFEELERSVDDIARKIIIEKRNIAPVQAE